MDPPQRLSIHSPLTAQLLSGETLLFYVSKEVPRAQRLQLHAKLLQRGHKVTYLESEAQAAATRGVVVVGTEVVPSEVHATVPAGQTRSSAPEYATVLQLMQIFERLPRPSPAQGSTTHTSSSRTNTITTDLSGSTMTKDKRRTVSAPREFCEDCDRETKLLYGLRADKPLRLRWCIDCAEKHPGARQLIGLEPAPERPDGPAKQLIRRLGWDTPPHYTIHTDEAVLQSRLAAGRQTRKRQEKLLAALATSIDAARAGPNNAPANLRTVLQLLAEHPEDVHSQDEHGRTALWLASASGCLEAIEELAYSGACIDQPDHDGATALYAACHRGDAEVVDTLLRMGSNPEQTNRDRASPMQVACQNGHLECASLLFEHGIVHFDRPSKRGVTPLFAAACGGHTDVMRLLLFNGASIEHCNASGVTAFMAACANDKLDAALVLLDWGANLNHVDASGASAFLVACREGHLETVKWLASLAPHVDMRKADHEGTTPFLVAVLQHHRDIVVFLRSLGLDNEKTVENPFRNCVRNSSLRAHKEKGRQVEQAEAFDMGVRQSLDAVLAPARKYAIASDVGCGPGTKAAIRQTILRRHMGSFVGVLDRHNEQRMRQEARAEAVAKAESKRRATELHIAAKSGGANSSNVPRALHPPCRRPAHASGTSSNTGDVQANSKSNRLYLGKPVWGHQLAGFRAQRSVVHALNAINSRQSR